MITIKNKEREDIGTNGLLKRHIALKVINGTNYSLVLILLCAVSLIFSGDTGISFTYKDVSIRIPAINSQAAAAIAALIGIELGRVSSMMSQVVSYYFGTNVRKDESTGKTHSEQDNTHVK